MASSRLTEKWINRGLWLISFVFAFFLIGLGGLVVADLPKVQTTSELRDFVDNTKLEALQKDISIKEASIEKLYTQQSDENTKLTALKNAYFKSKETFNNWLAARQATEDGTQNSEVLSKTKDLEKQQAAIQVQEEKVNALNKQIADKQAELKEPTQQKNEIEEAGYKAMAEVQRSNEVKVFIYRLAVTLPLLLIGAWLFARKRQGQYWPFVWGFIFFALFAFFVELVPYLPSYGGYVRYMVGMLVTLFAGHYGIKALQKYLENQKKAEAMPSTELKEKLSYELAQQRLTRGICPGCERPIDLKDPARNYCIHCGTCVYNNCVSCNTRKNAFAKHCHSCGTAA